MSNDETKPESETETPSETQEAETRSEASAAASSESESSSAKSEEKSESPVERKAPRKSTKPSSKQTSAKTSGGKLAAFVAIGLLLGGALGWFGRELVQKQAIAKATDACDSWKTKVCSELGEKSSGCQDATAAKTLLPTAACLSALDDIQTTIRSAKAARAVCDTLTSRLCGEIGPGTDTCKMITEQTQSFPTSQCELMTAQYDKVLESVRQLAAQQEMMRQGGMGMPPGMPPH